MTYISKNQTKKVRIGQELHKNPSQTQILLLYLTPMTTIPILISLRVH